MRLKIYFISLLMLLFFLGCGGIQSDHPELETGMKLTQAYQAVYHQYQETYRYVSSENQEFMKTEIAPKMDQLKEDIILYNEAVLAGNADPDQRQAIFSQLRAVSHKLTKMEESSDES